MLHLLTLYLHLLATCAAIGLVLASDLRVGAQLWHRVRHLEARRTPLRLQPPSRFVVRTVAAALAVLIASGALLVALALEARPDALANPKLQAKIGFVLALVLNAWALHRYSFAAMAALGEGSRTESRPLGPLARWRRAAAVAAPVAVSQAGWGYCAFLGIARPWNFRVPLEDVLAIGALAMAATWLASTALLAVASAPAARRVRPIPTLRVAPEPVQPAR